MLKFNVSPHSFLAFPDNSAQKTPTIPPVLVLYFYTDNSAQTIPPQNYIAWDLYHTICKNAAYHTLEKLIAVKL